MVSERISDAVPGRIDSTIKFDDIVVVLFEQENVDDNICGVNPDGTVEWQIGSTNSPSGDENPYVKIWEKDDELWAADWKGMDYRIDPQNGQKIDKKYRK